MTNLGLIKFQIADIHFGMSADRILEIVRLDDFRTIPQPLPYIVGLTELRNYIVTIVDFRKRLGLSPLHRDRGTTMIVLKLSFGAIGLLVESISNFTRVPETEILSPFSIAGLPAQLLLGVLAADEDIMIIPDLNKIFSSYIPLQLSSITPSEKIAFQYRSTPGAIARTLENTLVNQGYLDEEIILKLPRSTNLPPVQVHKFISYYPDFQPRTTTSSRQEPATGTRQRAKAGDETYSSLSKQLESRQQHSYARRSQHDRKRLPDLPFTPQQGAAHAFETILQQRSVEGGQQLSSRRVLSDRDIGRHIAKTLRVKPVQLCKYFTFYPQDFERSPYPSLRKFFARVSDERRSAAQTLGLDERLNDLLRHSRYTLEEVLQTLEKEAYPLQRKALRRIGEHYNVSQITIARLAGNFPKLQLDFAKKKEDTCPPDDENGLHAQEDVQNELDETPCDAEAYRELKAPVRKLQAKTANLNACLQYLAERELLEDEQAVRAVASQLHASTCRLSKLRTYYQFRKK